MVSIPETIHQIYIDRSSSPWSFLSTLGYLVGGSSTPRGFLHKLKLSLLLSLVSTGSSNKVNTLVVGTDTTIIKRLVNIICSKNKNFNPFFINKSHILSIIYFLFFRNSKRDHITMHLFQKVNARMPAACCSWL